MKKNISLVRFYCLTKFNCLVAVTAWDIAQYMYCNCLLTRLWRHKLWNKPYLSNQAVLLLHGKKVNTKFKYLEDEKELLRWNKKHFSTFLKGFYLKQIKQFFLEGESPTLKWVFLKTQQISQENTFLESILVSGGCFCL